ncbi:putative bifunctional diguanylate cyclase/phosphodiesterase [Gluconacetobacter sp. Hr-1-5]|uniref:putative bifunctional diguanylate cyclase/phosphodiesterase n=1 Tax=Gluconacetobacter sp. Hr-1-5 TaxID=3395370 RepID=UPI003B526065
MHHLPFREAGEFIRYALDSAAIVAITDARGTITFVNDKFCQVSGYDRDELIGCNHRILRSDVHDAAFFRLMYRQIASGQNWHGEICNRRKDGTLYWVDTTIVPHVSQAGKVDSYVAIRFDITARKLAEDELRTSREHLRTIANLDALTNLPNRRYFREYVGGLIGQYGPSGRQFYLALMDIDAFKEINDSFGHDAGDHLLEIMVSRLRSVVDDRVFIARLGGDEFGIIFDETEEDEARRFYEKVLEAIRDPIQIDTISWHCSASMGYAAFHRHGDDATSLIKAADLALYHAKALGRDRLEGFHPELLASAEKKSQALLEIEAGLKCRNFHFSYQPIVFRAPERHASLEALIRWQHPQRGLLMPADFQAVLTDPAMSAVLGMYMLDRVFRDMQVMLDKSIPFGRVAINMTNSDFRSDSFLDRFFSRCAETGIGPERFCVEVTERMFLGRDQKRVEQGLRRLHAEGVEVALDDFGTGYASLTHLQELPIDRLKIDRRFVSSLTTSYEDQVIVRGVIDIAHGLGKAVTAEGVETASQARMLLDMQCDSLQGWYFSKACAVAVLPSAMQRLPERLDGLLTR